MQRYIFLTAGLLGICAVPLMAAAEGFTGSISPRYWTNGETYQQAQITLIGASLSLGHSDSPFSLSLSYMAGSDGESDPGQVKEFWAGGKMINGEQTISEAYVNWRASQSLMLFAGVIQSKWSNDIDYFGVKPNEKMSEEYTMPKLGVVSNSQIGETGRHHLFSTFALSSGKKEQYWSGDSNPIPAGNSGGVDLQFGYQYNIEGIGGLNIRYRFLYAGGGDSALSRNAQGLEFGTSFTF